MNEIDKLTLSIEKLQPKSQYIFRGDVVSEERFNSIEWHTENTLPWSAVQTEMTRLQTEYDAKDYGAWNVGEDGRQRISREQFVVSLVKAVQELSAKVVELENKLGD